MNVWRAILFPFSILYDLITRVRNYLYRIGHKKSFRFETMVISVGNLAVGGSGKTPMVEYLIRLLTERYKLATLSRGYGRRTKGFRVASDIESATTVGDEPYQLYRKFGKLVSITVAEDRAYAIPLILQQDPSPDVILMDDAFQHRAVDPQFSILMTDFNYPFYKDYILPAGNLRESRTNASRSNAIVVTRCDEGLRLEAMKESEEAIHRYAPDVPVFFTGIRYEAPVPFGSVPGATQEIILVTGIANSQSLVDHVSSSFTLVRHFEFRDHHRYTLSDVEMIHEFYSKEGRKLTILTTEKDRVKLMDGPLAAAVEKYPWFYQPIQATFLKNGPEFDTMVLHSIEKSIDSLEVRS